MAAPGGGRQEGERLQKVLAAAGAGSRRACEALIVAGRVEVNGQVVRELGIRVHPGKDEIRVDGRPIPTSPKKAFTYLMMHKPPGFLTTLHDPWGGPTVAELLPGGLPRVFPVGRLDRDSTGLLLFTDDGELAARLLHPRYGIPKRYRVKVRGVPSLAALDRLRRGIPLEDGMTAPAEVALLSRGPGWARLQITLTEGRKRQVRRMMDQVGCPVLELKRVGFGPLRLGRLPEGAVRPLTPREVEALRAAAFRAPTKNTGSRGFSKRKARQRRSPMV